MMEHDYRDVLLKAASYVEQGWMQGALCDDEALNIRAASKWCAVGALRRASLDLFDDACHPTLEQAAHAVEKPIRVPLSSWNDTEGRTADEVADALRRAAE